MAKKPTNTYPLKYVTENLDSILSGMISEYCEELEKKAEEITLEVAKDFSEKLKSVTPRSDSNTDPHLADTIIVTSKKEKEFGKTVKAQYVHYKKWQIVHLLEFGWTKLSGERVTRTPFIRPLFDTNKDRYYNMYKEGLKRD